MIGTLLSAVLAASIAGLVTHLLVPVVIEVAKALRTVRRSDDRRRNSEEVPRLGGIAIVAGLALGACGVAMIEWNRWGITIGRSELVALAIGTLMVFLVGVVDDLLGVSVTKKFLFQLAAGYLLVHLGWSFHVLSLPGLGEVHLGAFGPLVSLLWIVGVTNAINLLDGLDGLAAGVVAIIALGLLTYAMLQGAPLTVVLMAAMAGAALGFLAHNWAPARIFMGDSGSLTLGFLLAVMSLHSSLKAPATVAILVPILALGLPVADTLVVMGVRFLDQPHGRLGDRFLRMFHADRNHLHHTLERFVANRRRVVAAIYGAVLAFCAMALVVAVTHNVVLGLVLVAVEFAAVLAMRNLGRVVRAGNEAWQKGGAWHRAGVWRKAGAGRKGQAVANLPPPARRRRG
jgi:UDP-GlcNAc:undecaprenyl-phosphate GlcNAc-1-phosphate transferase